MPLINREIKTINSHVIKVMLIMNSSKNNVTIIIIDYVINCECLPKKGKKKKSRDMCEYDNFVWIWLAQECSYEEEEYSWAITQ